jgi:hypothetical protein
VRDFASLQPEPTREEPDPLCFKPKRFEKLITAFQKPLELSVSKSVLVGLASREGTTMLIRALVSLELVCGHNPRG